MYRIKINSGITLILCLCALTNMISGCKTKETAPPTVEPELKIDYSAAYIINGQSAELSVLNLSSGEVTATLPLKDLSGAKVAWPHHIYLSPDKTTLAVSVPGMDMSGGHSGGMEGMSGKVLLIDALKGTTTRVIDCPAMPHNAVFRGDEIWIGQMKMDGKVRILNAQTLALKQEINVGKDPAEVTFSADGTRAFVACGGSDSVWVIDPTAKATLAVIPVGDNPVGAWPGGDKMFVDNEDGKSITVLKVSDLTTVTTIPLGFNPGYAAYLASENQLWVSNPADGKAVVYHEMSPGEWMLLGEVATGAGAHAIAFSPDKATAYITNQTANTLSLVKVSTLMKIKDITVGTKPNGLCIREK